MYPILCEALGYKIPADPVILVAAFVFCATLGAREFRHMDPPVRITPLGAFLVVVGALYGGRIYWLLQYHDPKQLFHNLYTREGGIASFGMLLGGSIAGYIYVTLLKVPKLKAADAGIPYVALYEALARIGCFLGGCCYGAPTSMPWGVCFGPDSPAYARQSQHHLVPAGSSCTLPVHPTQLYMTLGLLLLVAVLLRGLHRSHRDGTVLLLYGMFYGALRFVVEIWRDDTIRPILNMTPSQVLCLCLFTVSLVCLASRRLAKPETETRT